MKSEKTRELEAYERGDLELKDVLRLTREQLQQLCGRAQFFLEGGHDERALIMVEMLEELDRTEPLYAVIAANMLRRAGRSDAALDKLHGAIELHPDNPEISIALAEVHVARGELDTAAELLDRVIGRDPEGQTVWGARALATAHRAWQMCEEE